MYIPHRRNRPSAAFAGTDYPRRRAGRAFTTVELAVSLGIFLVVSAIITITIARSIGAGTEVRAERASDAAASDMLAALAAYDYDTLVAGTFTVPSPCTGTTPGSGIDGRSCLDMPGAQVEVRYFYADGAGDCPDLEADPEGTGAPSDGTALAASEHRVGLCAVGYSTTGAAPAGLTTLTRSANAPTADYLPGMAVVRVAVAGNSADSAFPTALYLVRESDPTFLVTGPVSLVDEVAAFTLDPDSECTQEQPCVVALAPSLSPALVAGEGLYGASARPGADIVARAGQPLDLQVSAAPAPQVAAVLTAPSSPPIPNTVCLSATGQSSGMSATACNTGDASQVLFDAYTALVSGQEVIYPLDPGDRLTVTTDPASGVCPALGRSPSAVGVWADAAVCTSWTWGQASSLPASVELVEYSGAAQTVSASWDSLSPAYGLTSTPTPWQFPRITPDCAASGTCAPVLSVPEQQSCPGLTCLSVDVS